MPETDGISPYMLKTECMLTNNNIITKLDNINVNVRENRGDIDKITKILVGNGEEGIIIQLKRLTWRNQVIDKLGGVVIGIVSGVLCSIISLILAGVLHI